MHRVKAALAQRCLPAVATYTATAAQWASLFTAWELEPQARLARHAQNGFVTCCDVKAVSLTLSAPKHA
jgi:hypothetical protein